MSDLERTLRRELDEIHEGFTPHAPVPMARIVSQGRAIRRRRTAARAAAVALVVVGVGAPVTQFLSPVSTTPDVPSTTPSPVSVSRIERVASLPAEVERLRSLGVVVQGDLAAAIRWTDRLGTNDLVLTEAKQSTTTDGALFTTGTQRVYHVVTDAAGKATVLARYEDPGAGPCALDFGIGVVQESLGVTDVDGNGIGEATAGWWRQCRGDLGPINLTLALVSNGSVHILEGSGALRSQMPTAQGKDAIPTPDPAAQDWTPGTLAAATDVWNRIYYEPDSYYP